MILDADRLTVGMQGARIVGSNLDGIAVENLNALDAGVLADEYRRKH